MPIVTLKRRPEFLRVRGGARWGTLSLNVEARCRVPAPLLRMPDDSPAGATNVACDASPRFGFTVTKKLGNAVVRNRIRRRLREAVRQVAQRHGRNGADYVIFAREVALKCRFSDLTRDLETALERVNRRLASSGRSS